MFVVPKVAGKKDVLMLSTIHEHDEAIFVETGKVTDCVFRREGHLLCLKWREKRMYSY